MFNVAQRVGGTAHKRTNDSFTNTKVLGISEEVVGIFLDFCYRSILIKKFLIKVAITYLFFKHLISGGSLEDFTSFSIFFIMIFLS